MADATTKWGIDTGEARAGIKSLADLVDDVASELERPHTLGVDASEAEKGVRGVGDEIKRLRDEKGRFIKIEVDTSEAEPKVKSFRETITELATAAKAALTFDSIASVADTLGGISEKGGELAATYKQVAAQTGLFGDELEAVKDRADVAFRSGLGENLAEATKALGTAQQQLGAFLEPEEIDAFALKMGGVASTFDVDMNEAIGKGRTLISSFGLDGEKAGDLISLAMQKAGNAQGDVLDTLDEYSPHFKAAGISAEGFVNILTTGVQAGARDTDKLGDAIKEMTIRLAAGDISKAVGEINISGSLKKQIDEVVKLGETGVIQGGEVMQRVAKMTKDAFDAGEISDQIASQLNVAVAGTPAEDIGREMYGRIYSAPVDPSAVDAAAKTAGDQISKAMEPSFLGGIARTFSSIGDQAAAFFAPIAGPLSDILGVVGSIGPAVAALWPLFAAGGGIMATVGTAATTMWAAITGPVGLVIAAIAAVIAIFVLAYNTSDDFREAIDSLWESITGFVSELWDNLKPVLESVWELIKEVAEFIWSVVVAYFKAWWAVISEVVDVIGGLIGGMLGASKGGDVLGSVMKALGAAFEVVKKIVDGMRIGLAGIGGAFSAAIATIKNAVGLLADLDLKGAYEAMTGLGASVAKGFNDAAKAKFRELNVPDAMRDAFQGTDEAPAVKETAKKVGTGIGTSVGTAAKVAAAQPILSLAQEIERLLHDIAELTADATRDALVAAQVDPEKLINFDFDKRRTAITEGLDKEESAILAKTKDKNGKERKLSAAEAEELTRALTLIAEKRKLSLDKIDREREEALRKHFANLAAIRRQETLDSLQSVADRSEVRPIVKVAPEWSLASENADRLAVAIAKSLDGLDVKINTRIEADFGGTDTARLQGELDTLRGEESLIALSIARRGEMSQEDADRRIELMEQIASKEEELAARTVTVWKIAQSTLAATFETIRDTFRTTFDESVQKIAEGTDTLTNSLDDALIYINSAMLSALANQEDAGKAFLGAMFDVLQSLVPILSAQILGFALATPTAIATLGTSALLEWTALTAILTTAVQGARAIGGFWGGVVGLDTADHPGGYVRIPGDYSRRDSIFAMVAAGETFVTRDATAHNTPLLEAMNRWPMVDFMDVLSRARREEIRAFVAEEARSFRIEIARERHQTTEATATAAANTAQLAAIARELQTLRTATDAQTTEIRKGIPIRGTSTVRRGQIHETLVHELRHRRARAT